MRNEDKQDEARQAIDQALVALLSLLWEARQTLPDKPWSLAKLGKRSGVQMSALLRQLNALSSAGLVNLAAHDNGAGSAVLSAAGHDLCATVFAQPPAEGLPAAE
jgi:DNA-binding IclR family transcriptional regulator